MNSENTALVLVAGGHGARMGSDLPKQYIEVNGRQIIEHTILTFYQSQTVGKLIIVCAKDYIDHIKMLINGLNLDIPVFVTEGGNTRQSSVYNGLKLAVDCKYVMIHDAVRCCISVDEIKKLTDILWSDKACALGVRVKDTLKCSDENGVITSTVDRHNLWHIQTPQAFLTSDIILAHQKAIEDNFFATDDCALAESVDIIVTIVEGKETNLKVTTPVDLIIASQILEGRII